MINQFHSKRCNRQNYGYHRPDPVSVFFSHSSLSALTFETDGQVRLCGTFLVSFPIQAKIDVTFFRSHLLLTLLCFSLRMAHLVAQPKTQDTSDVVQYYEQGKKLYASDKDSAYLLFTTGLALADTLGFNRGQLILCRAMSSFEANRANLAACSIYVARGIAVVKEMKLPLTNHIDFLINHGAAYLNAGQPGSALQLYIEAEEMARLAGLEEKHAILLNNLGAIYRRLNRYDDAIRIYQQSLSLRKEHLDTMGIANNYHNLAAAYGWCWQTP